MMNSSADIEESAEPKDFTEIRQSADSATSQESSEVPKAEDKAPTPRTETSVDSEESGQSARNGEIEEPSGESTGSVEVQESSGTATDHDAGGPSGTEIREKSVTTQREPDMETQETTEDTQSAGGEMGEERVPLDSQTGALVPFNDPSVAQQSFLESLWSFCTSLPWRSIWDWYFGEPSQTQNDENAENPDNGETAVPEMRNDDCNAGNSDASDEEYEILEPHAADEVVNTKEMSFDQKKDKIMEIMQSSCTILWYFIGHHTVGIFSRSSESDYKWLISVLQSQPFQRITSTVQNHHISNNGRLQFMEAVSQCTFGILYHTRNRGRINIVDVTDSLYDEELQYMSERLGRQNVIVVVDDLEDTSDKSKSQILKEQPSITKLAQETFLFSATEKKAMPIGEMPEGS